jgi:hypothetical protein
VVKLDGANGFYIPGDLITGNALSPSIFYTSTLCLKEHKNHMTVTL